MTAPMTAKGVAMPIGMAALTWLVAVGIGRANLNRTAPWHAVLPAFPRPFQLLWQPLGMGIQLLAGICPAIPSVHGAEIVRLLVSVTLMSSCARSALGALASGLLKYRHARASGKTIRQDDN